MLGALGIFLFSQIAFAGDSTRTFVAFRGEGQIYSNCDSPRRWPSRHLSICFHGNGSYDLRAVESIERTLDQSFLSVLQKKRVDSVRFVCSDETRYERQALIVLLPQSATARVEIPCRLSQPQAFEAWSAARTFLTLDIEAQLDSIFEVRAVCASAGRTCATFRSEIRNGLLFRSSSLEGKVLAGPGVKISWGESEGAAGVPEGDLAWLKERTVGWDVNIEDDMSWFDAWLESRSLHCAPPLLNLTTCQSELHALRLLMEAAGIFSQKVFDGFAAIPTPNSVQPATLMFHTRLSEADRHFLEAANLAQPQRAQALKSSTSKAEWLRDASLRTAGFVFIKKQEKGGSGMDYAEGHQRYPECHFDYDCLQRDVFIHRALGGLFESSELKTGKCNRGRILGFDGAQFQIEWSVIGDQCEWEKRQ